MFWMYNIETGDCPLHSVSYQCSVLVYFNHDYDVNITFTKTLQWPKFIHSSGRLENAHMNCFYNDHISHLVGTDKHLFNV